MAKIKTVTSTGLALTGSGTIYGFVCGTHSSGTLKLEDSIGGGQNTLMSTYTLPTGAQVVRLPKELPFTNGLYATVGGSGTFDLVID